MDGVVGVAGGQLNRFNNKLGIKQVNLASSIVGNNRKNKRSVIKIDASLYRRLGIDSNAP